jgi:ribonucleoside-triphosphate reductase
MTAPFEDTEPKENEAAREGAFDPQLSFPAFAPSQPEPLTTIVKRDGREAPFDKGKIAAAIQRASEAAGESDQDRSDSLASAVAMYLSKHVQGKATVDQVNDAVERVLVELGHGRAALAYARFRDKRARLRQLRSGNLQSLLHELTEARDGEQDLNNRLSLFVRTSDETMARWDRERIVEALVRETAMDRALAELVAAEVERQIAAAGIERVTTSLVRELVDAKLVEHGLEHFRRRHTRLGVPLFDAEKIICVPNRDEAAVARNPHGTDLELAERVKREFALNHVYGQEESDAHLRGDLHLHDLGRVDRLRSCGVSLAYVTRFGIADGGRQRGQRPARRADALIHQASQFAAQLRGHFSGPLVWRHFNAHLAPFAAQLSADDLDRFVQMALSAIAPPPDAVVSSGESPRSEDEVELTWHAPSALGSHELRPTRSGRDPMETARRVSTAALRAFADAADAGFPGLRPVLRVSPACLSHPEHSDYLQAAARLLHAGVPLRILFERRTLSPDGLPWQLSTPTLQGVTLNLARAGGAAADEGALNKEIGRLMAVAIRAHDAKRAFVHRLLEVTTFGPLAFLAQQHYGDALLDMQRLRYRVGITGLNECVRAIKQQDLHESDEALQLGRRIVRQAADAAVRLTRDSQAALEIAAESDPVVAARFAALDLKELGDSVRKLIQTDPITQDVHYTPGANLPISFNGSPIERVRLEGRLHDAAPVAAFTRVAVSPDASAGAIAHFIRKCCRHTQCASLLLHVER